MSTPEYLEMPTGEQIAVLAHRAEDRMKDKPGLFWLGGFKSAMTGTKASALARWAESEGMAACRFDYSGNGFSDNGNFEDATISLWLDQSLAVFDGYTQGPQIVFGSSMGGWLAVLLYMKLAARGDADRVSGLVPIAPAADMTEALMWKLFPDEIRACIEENGVWYRPSDYGDGDYPITGKLIEDGRKHLILGEKIEVSCPVRILHGDCDPDVPWEHGLRLYNTLSGSDVTFTLIKNGDHRLSSQEEIARLIATAAGLAK
ncbi:MAG: alpha/beta hydrolase [Hyphomicrobiales bacterium]